MNEEVILNEEENRWKDAEVKMENLELFFNQAAELLQEKGTYPGHVKHKVVKRERGAASLGTYHWTFLTITQETPRRLRFPQRTYILVFTLDDIDMTFLQRFGKKEIIIDIYDLKEYDNLVKLLKPLAQKLSENTGLKVILNKQPNFPGVL